MKFYLHILFLFTLGLVALPTSWVQDFSGVEIEIGVKTVSHPSSEHCAPVDDECVDTHPGQDCPPDTDGCGHCHCPGCGAPGGMTYAGFFKNTFSELTVVDWSYADRAANFCYNTPCSSAHPAALFQPPRA
ncbi:MAG TPA: hypothetical protein PLO67_01125 [Saprospiraceae bacterium]|nr:hypothetical protein [Saprospiraceae bacterium]HPI04814.1 hypothetical protein [Saprospiraceae bacterium]